MNQNGADDVKKHRFFAGFSWDGLFGRTLAAPFVPEVSEHKAFSAVDGNALASPHDISFPPPPLRQVHGPKDTSNFDKYQEPTDDGLAPIFDADAPDPFLHF